MTGLIYSTYKYLISVCMCDVHLMQVKAGVGQGRVWKGTWPAWLRALGSFPSTLNFQAKPHQKQWEPFR